MKIGFDEIYVVIKYAGVLYNEYLYDSKEADKQVKKIKDKGYVAAYKASLEYAFVRKIRIE